MRAVAQRVREASVSIDGERVGEIGAGLMVLVGAAHGDTDADLGYVIDKLVHLRIFADADGKMNRSVLDIGGGVLWISQFTLLGDCRKGRRPSFIDAMAPEPARELYERGFDRLRATGVAMVAGGRFGADMQVALVNDGPVTMLLDSRRG